MFVPVTLDYDFYKILAADHDSHSGSCYHHRVQELDDIYGQYGDIRMRFARQIPLSINCGGTINSLITSSWDRY